MKFNNQVAIVTGGGSGIGRMTALMMAQEGAELVVADINETHGTSVVREITDQGGRAIFILCDVERPDHIKNLVDKTVQTFGHLNVIVNNAALMTFASITDISLETWDRVMMTNLRPAFLLCKYGIPLIEKGAIVNVSSVHGHQTTPCNVPYATSKGALEAFTRAVSLEVDMGKVRINSLAPGAVNTPMLWANPNIKSGREKITGRIAEPEEIASAICFLASSEASFIHGTTLVVDGGRLDVL